MGFFDSIGGVVNDILGGTTSARKANKYALHQQAVQNTYNKETMQNLHQWEVEDLKKAGLNPALGYGGNTSGIATGTASGPQAATGDPISMIATAVGIGNQLKENELTSAKTAETDASRDKAIAETAGIIESNKWITPQKKEEWINTIADTALKNAQTASAKKSAELAEETKKLTREETKYTRERARGYSESETRSVGHSFWGLGGNTARTISRTQ